MLDFYAEIGALFGEEVEVPSEASHCGLEVVLARFSDVIC